MRRALALLLLAAPAFLPRIRDRRRAGPDRDPDHRRRLPLRSGQRRRLQPRLQGLPQALPPYRKAEARTLETVQRLAEEDDEPIEDGEKPVDLERLKGFEFTLLEFDPYTDELAALGWAQAEAVLAELDAGRPVGVGIIGHVFAATGYREYADGRLVLEIRDSDGGRLLQPEEFGEIHRLFRVK
ncbi:MAG: hypothetical protein HYZ75_08830 [Elusimicrobia bacterium]|nr:hypothetical protein [Elusimicrobiota bacterium]